MNHECTGMARYRTKPTAMLTPVSPVRNGAQLLRRGRPGGEGCHRVRHLSDKQ